MCPALTPAAFGAASCPAAVVAKAANKKKTDMILAFMADTVLAMMSKRKGPAYIPSAQDFVIKPSDRLPSMKRFIFVSALLVVIAAPAIMRTSAVPQADQHRAMVNTYCVTCHNARLKT